MMRPDQLISQIEDLHVNKKRRILDFLKKHCVKIHESSDGCRINISKLMEEDPDIYDALISFTKCITVVEDKFKFN
jgi:hypothetical protein